MDGAANGNVFEPPADPIPENVRVGAMGLARWMHLNQFVYWQLDGVCDIRIARAYGTMLKSLGFSHFLHHLPVPIDGTFEISNADGFVLQSWKASAGAESFIPFNLDDGGDVWMDFIPNDTDFKKPARVGPMKPLSID